MGYTHRGLPYICVLHPTHLDLVPYWAWEAMMTSGFDLKECQVGRKVTNTSCFPSLLGDLEL
jgi:hypothetical protein